MKAIIALFALVLVAALGAMAAGSIADAVEAWSAAKVQIAQIDANVEMYQIGIDAVQKANDRAPLWFMIGVLTVVCVLALPWLMRNFEEEGDYHVRQERQERPRSNARNSLVVNRNQREFTADSSSDWYVVTGAYFDETSIIFDIKLQPDIWQENYR